jgi:histidyl-tRNA synthetase
MLDAILKNFGIKCKLKLNSLGCKECMPKYRDGLKDKLSQIKDSLCEDCNKRIETNPIRVFDCKNSACQEALSDMPRIYDALCESCRSDFNKLQELLKLNFIKFEIDKNLVRGLDYYSKSAFEFVSDKIGAQSAVAGGGRYDRLVEYLGGKETPGIGFAIGVERLLELVEMPQTQREGVYLGVMVAEARDRLFEKSIELRKNIKVYFEPNLKKLKNHLKAADKLGAKFCAIVGEDEFKEDKIWVKNLQTKEEHKESLKILDMLINPNIKI